MTKLFESSDLYERFCLVKERISQIPDDKIVSGEISDEFFYLDFFIKKAEKINNILNNYNRFSLDNLSEVEELKLSERNDLYYKDIVEEYATSYSNPDYAEERLGIYGKVLSFVSAEIDSLPVAISGRSIDGEAEAQAVRGSIYLLELFILLYGMFKNEEIPTLKEVEEAVYYYAFDYIEDVSFDRTMETLVPDYTSIASRIIYQADLTDTRYLYLYGDYITESELKLSKFLSEMTQEEIDKCAFVYTDGFRRGFDVMGVNFEGKKTVNIRYHLGQERIVRAAVKNFADMGLEPIFSRCSFNRMVRRGVTKQGYESTSPNMQFEYDHRMDDTFFLDGRYVDRRINATSAAYEYFKEEAAAYAGPAVIETFGEDLFSPVAKESVASYSDKQNELSVKLYSKMGQISNQYIPGDSYSFTIIAFPLPDIGESFEEIFRETAILNSLDNDKYIKIQQSIIDVLDKADVVKVKGMNGNRTDMTVKMRVLENPEKETQFENCTADVNIPLGEVFTSPVLKGTKGILNVSKVYLNGYLFKDLEISFQDGVVKDYHCANFEEEEAGRKYIKENILFNHEFLPIGEFAIGTNTYAYVMAQKYNILDKLPILIVEKTGPHFAVGDTCYSHAEDHAVYNPDGKEIVSRENDFSLLRDTEPDKAYFNCHTDITIPYNEIGRLYTVDSDGNEIDIIVDGRFVLTGTEALNEAFE